MSRKEVGGGGASAASASALRKDDWGGLKFFGAVERRACRLDGCSLVRHRSRAVDSVASDILLL